MKKVLIIADSTEHYYKFDSVEKQKNREKTDNFQIKRIIVKNINKIMDIYKKELPDVLFIDTIFEQEEKSKFLTEFPKIKKNYCKIILTCKDKKERQNLEKIKLAHRLFLSNMPDETIYYSIKEMIDDQMFAYEEQVFKLINLLNLDYKSSATMQFVYFLEILAKETGKYLFSGHLYNVIYEVSACKGNSTETVRKNLATLREKITETIEPDLKKAIFGENKNLFELDASSYYEFLVEYLKTLK